MRKDLRKTIEYMDFADRVLNELWGFPPSPTRQKIKNIYPGSRRKNWVYDF